MRVECRATAGASKPACGPPRDDVKKTAMGCIGALRQKQALLQQRMAKRGPYSCRPFVPELLPVHQHRAPRENWRSATKQAALVPGKQVKNGTRSRANLECCENGTKAKFIRAHSSVRRHCAAVGKALKIGPNITPFRHFFDACPTRS